MTQDAGKPANPIGYANPAYVALLRHVGEPVGLAGSGGWLLRRPIPDSDLSDYIGPYPLFMCDDWTRLTEDLAALRQSAAVSVVLVPDPFGGWTPALLESVFDVVRVVKRRWIADLTTDVTRIISAHHQQKAKRALRRMEVERCTDPRQHADEWSRCYRTFATERKMTGAATFPLSSLAAQVSIPGALLYRASCGGRTVGFSLWMVQGVSAYGHLMAYTADGRLHGAAYAFYWEILRHLQTLGVERADLGGGLDDDDGLARWKAGWTPESRPSFLCGAILRPAEYHALTRAHDVAHASYFPAYRTPFGQ